jgi:uncharacterized protein YfaS (alpha-2-macroglobulin family)
MNDIRLNDYGTKFLVTVKDQDNQVYPVSGQTLEFWFCKPDGSVLSKTPTLVETGVYGQCYYITQSGDINALGIWRLQLKITGTEKEFFSDISSFRVTKNVNAE